MSRGVRNAEVSRGIEEKLFRRPLSDLVEKLGIDNRLERLWKVIEADYWRPEIRLDKVARECAASKNQLNLILREATTFTFHQLLTRYRLLRAIQMMQRKTHGVSEVTLAVGFGSISSFERNSQKILGARPKELAKVLRPKRA